MPAIRLPGIPKRSKLPGSFRFKAVSAPGNAITPRFPRYPETPETEIMVINGRQAGSKTEWYIYKALVQAGVDAGAISYQVPWHGGRVMGGQVLDFVLRRGGPTEVIRVMGQYWHANGIGTPLDQFARSQMINENLLVYDIPDTGITDTESAAIKLSKHRVI